MGAHFERLRQKAKSIATEEDLPPIEGLVDKIKKLANCPEIDALAEKGDWLGVIKLFNRMTGVTDDCPF